MENKDPKRRKIDMTRKRLLTGAYIPTIQLGTYRMKQPTSPCKTALSLGKQSAALREQAYGGIDTASIYNNEAGCGQAVRSIVNSGIRERRDIYVQTKLWRSHQGLTSSNKSKMQAALRSSLKKLDCEYIDLFLMHWPGPGRHLSKPPVRKCKDKVWGWDSKKRDDIEGNDEIRVPKDWSAEMRLQTFKEMVQSSGPTKSVRAVGVCNFSARQLDELIRFCEKEKILKPVVVQNECHPFLPATKVREICSKHGIVFQAYASLGSGGDTLLKHEKINQIAKSHHRTPAQILLRWAVQHGMVVVPKTTSKDRMIENANIFDFELTSKDMSILDSLSDEKSVSQTTKFCWLREHDPDHY